MNNGQGNAVGILIRWLAGRADVAPPGRDTSMSVPNDDTARNALELLARGAYRQLMAGPDDRDVRALWPDITARLGDRATDLPVHARVSGTRRQLLRAIAHGEVHRDQHGTVTRHGTGTRLPLTVTGEVAALLGYGLARCPVDVGPVELTDTGRAAIRGNR